MRTYIDLAEQKFGRLTVIDRVSSNKYGDTIWKCKCDCENIISVSAKKLKSGNTQSCGCLRDERVSASRRLQYGDAALNRIEDNYKQGAARRNLIYEITKEQLKESIIKPCFYCGCEPSNKSQRKTSYGAFIYNGLDRIDNEKGYTIDNIITCCKRCNTWKGKLTQQEFLDHNERIHNHRVH